KPMKNNYLILLLGITLLSATGLTAQVCPANGFTNSSSLFFFYDPGTVPCVDRPSSVTVDASVFNLVECEEGYAIYDLVSGSALTDFTYFVADFGAATCEYTNGNLTQETLSVSTFDKVLESTVVFPNPLTQGNHLNIVFSHNIHAKANVYNITGKLLLSKEIDNLNRQKLDVGNLANGVYLLQVETETGSISKKIVIAR
ncbi:MAG TPA: T9SS type A sorting domain-containing protein, partial [Mangrovimonas sp.]|nr:T9SS type A sorting domain-containing protein [Mangrovimonas sp.]